MKAIRKFIRWWRSPSLHEMDGGLFAWDDAERDVRAADQNGSSK